MSNIKRSELSKIKAENEFNAKRVKMMGATVYLACEEYGLNEEKSAIWEDKVIDFHEDKNPVPCGICSRMLKNSRVTRVVNRSGDICL